MPGSIVEVRHDNPVSRLVADLYKSRRSTPSVSLPADTDNPIHVQSHIRASGRRPNQCCLGGSELCTVAPNGQLSRCEKTRWVQVRSGTPKNQPDRVKAQRSGAGIFRSLHHHGTLHAEVRVPPNAGTVAPIQSVGLPSHGSGQSLTQTEARAGTKVLRIWTEEPQPL
jgi:hypothetical protein